MEKVTLCPKLSIIEFTTISHSMAKGLALSLYICISNKIRELHLNNLHNMYPSNTMVSRFTDIVYRHVYVLQWWTWNADTFFFYSCLYIQIWRSTYWVKLVTLLILNVITFLDSTLNSWNVQLMSWFWLVNCIYQQNQIF